MTDISRSIEISAAAETVWSHIDPQNWPSKFDFVREVDGYTDGRPGVGTQAKVVAGTVESPVRYNVEITEFKENERIVYKRYGGPLSGKGVMQLKPLHSGTLFMRTSYYDDDLSEATMQALSTGLENDNRRIKTQIESSR